MEGVILLALLFVLVNVQGSTYIFQQDSSHEIFAELVKSYDPNSSNQRKLCKTGENCPENDKAIVEEKFCENKEDCSEQEEVAEREVDNKSRVCFYLLDLCYPAI